MENVTERRIGETGGAFGSGTAVEEWVEVGEDGGGVVRS